MPQGYYTIEQWISPKKGKPPQWIPIKHLPFAASLTDAEKTLANFGKPGFYRMVQMQRVIWAEKNGPKLRLRKSHASSPESLDRVRQMFERCGGVYPIAEVREERRQARRKIKRERE
jgi:hypothetical protein